MKKFLVLYQSSASAREQMAHVSPEQLKAGMELWMTWATNAKPHIVDLGQPIVGGRNVAQDGKVSEASEQIGGYSILQAMSLDEAVTAVHQHPHFHSPNGSITILEMMPMPGM